MTDYIGVLIALVLLVGSVGGGLIITVMNIISDRRER